MMEDLEGRGVLVRCAILVIVLAAAALLPKGWSWSEKCVLAIAGLSAMVAIRSLLLADAASSAPIALLAAGVGFGILVFKRPS